MWVYSSHGTLAVMDDGSVYRPDYAYDDNELKDIVKFDIEEYLRAYPDEPLETIDSVDILDLGYWTKDGRYEPPDAYFRKEVADNASVRRITG
ncbi:MAG: hypothetical protein TUN42_04360 [Dehalogenimonas sp.]